MSEPYILILYFSKTGFVAKMAQAIAQGVERVPEISAKVRTVPNIIKENTEKYTLENTLLPENGPPFAEKEELENCAGLVLGSPAYFGNMAAPLKAFIDRATLPLWQSGNLVGKPAGCFTASSSLHGGQESTLLSMLLPLLHQGMLYMGIPYSETALLTTQTGGTPYGPSGLKTEAKQTLSSEERTLCHTFGKNIATLALKISS